MASKSPPIRKKSSKGFGKSPLPTVELCQLPNGLFQHPYGIVSPIQQNQLELEALAFVHGCGPSVGGLGRYQHFINYAKMRWPGEFAANRWNPWTERTLRQFCDDSTAHFHGNVRVKTTVMTGCATASKTWAAGFYAFVWWCMSPANSTVIFTSTTKEMIRRRIWPVVQHFLTSAMSVANPGQRVQLPFHVLESQTTIKCPLEGSSSSDLNAIFALAVAHGETQKAAHNQRMLLVVDEANGTPEAIFGTIPNQRKGCQNYELIVIGNPVSRMDPHGKCGEPKGGWSLVTEDTHQWLTKGVDEWEVEPGVCLRYDGKQSPNVLEYNKAVQLAKDSGRLPPTPFDRWPFLYTNADWTRASDPSRAKTLAYWSQSRGLHPPDGFCPTILSESMLEKYDPRNGEPFRWLSSKRLIAALDPAFGGDDCKLYFAEVGDIEGGKEAIQIIHTQSLFFEHASKDEVDYLIARQVIEECKIRGVQPEDFGLDRTGTGRGVAAIISAEWSQSIHQVEFGSMATDRPSSTADGRPAREVYANRVTEMWWWVREFLEAGQLRGIPLPARIELTTREYKMQGRRYLLEFKPDLKLRLGRSPDDADALCVLVDVARRVGLHAITRSMTSQDTAWNQLIKKRVEDSEDSDLELAGQTTRNRSQLVEMFDSGVQDDQWD